MNETPNKIKYRKVATLQIPDGTYTRAEDGREVNRWREVGVICASPHGNKLFLRLHATATSDGKIINIFPEKGAKFIPPDPVEQNGNQAAQANAGTQPANQTQPEQAGAQEQPQTAPPEQSQTAQTPDTNTGPEEIPF